MFLHCVYYWLKPDLSETQTQAYTQGIRDLLRLSTVRGGWFGPRAATEYPGVDSTYDFALVLLLEGSTGHDAFQSDPEHHALRAVLSPLWSRILIYDLEDG